MTKLFYFLFCLLCILVLFQDFLGIFLFNLGIPIYFIRIFLSLKDIIIISILLLNLMTCVVARQNIPINATIFFFVGYLVIVGIYFFRFGELSTIGSNINDLRSLIFPVYAYLAGYTAYYLKKEQMVRFVEKAALFSVVLSLWFYLLGNSFLVRLGVLNYTEDIRGYFGLIFKGLPSSYFTSLRDITIFRLAGPVFNPVGTATLYTFVAGLSIAYYRFVKKGYKRRILLALLVLAIFLTFSRGAIMGFILGLLFTDLLWRRRTSVKRPILIIYCVIAVLSIVFYKSFLSMIRDTFSLKDASAWSHYNALAASWEYLKNNWMGSGIGSMGMWRGTNYTGGAGENSFIFIIGQIGILAFIFLAGVYFSMIKKIIQHKDDYINYGLLICAVAVLFNSMFSPSLLTVTPMILFWFFIGYSEGSSRREHRAG